MAEKGGEPDGGEGTKGRHLERGSHPERRTQEKKRPNGGQPTARE